MPNRPLSDRAVRQNGLFLRHLRRTGNVGLAAEAAGASRRTLEDRRARHPEFSAAWATALAYADARLRAGRRDGEGPPTPVAEERRTVAAGGEFTVGGAHGRRFQVRRARPGQITGEGLRRFLSALSSTANVRLSAEAAGIGWRAVYWRRRRCVHFEEAMKAALAAGYDNVEFATLEQALRLLAPDGIDLMGWDEEDRPAPLSAMTVADAIHMLALHRRTQRLGAPRRNLRAPDIPIEEVRAEIVRLIDRQHRQDAREAARHRKRAAADPPA